MVVLRNQQGFANKQVWDTLVLAHGILQKVAIRYQQMSRQVTPLIKPDRLLAVRNVGRAGVVRIVTR